MTRYMQQVFSQVRRKAFPSSSDFLSFFEAEGCYLDDLSYVPVDNLPRAERRRAIDACVDEFTKRLVEFRPQHVVAVLKSIGLPVRKAVQFANLTAPVYAVPFPGQGNQPRFIAELTEILKLIYEPGV